MLNIPKSTVYRHVRMLCDAGFLEKQDRSNYQLGLTFLALGRKALKTNRDLRIAALPSMTRIAQKTDESVSLMKLFKQQVICIESIEGQHALRVAMEPGRTQPLHAGASSKLLLAHLPEEEWKTRLRFPLARLTETTITDFDDLKAELCVIQKQGYSTSNGEIDAGARAVAVAIQNDYQQIVAALSVEAPEMRMNDQTMHDYLALLYEEAQVIAQKLN